MPKIAKVAVAGGLIAVAVFAYVIVTTGESPIEVADGSVKLHFADGFDVDGTNAIRASKWFRHAQSIDVVGTSESIPVKNKAWTLYSFNRQLKITPDEYVLETDVPIATLDGTAISKVNPNDSNDFLYDPSDKSQFTPAMLTFTDGKCPKECSSCLQGTCTLTCPSGKCTIYIQYKK
jgi:hypothetical protein